MIPQSFALLQTELAAVFRREDVQPQPTSSSASPPAKKPRTSLFAHYSHSVEDSNQHRTPERQLTQYLDTINSPSFDLAGTSIADLVQRKEFSQLHQLFELVLCSPASSAPVERVFSQSGLIMRPHRAKMSDELLEALVFLKCNTQTSIDFPMKLTMTVVAVDCEDCDCANVCVCACTVFQLCYRLNLLTIDLLIKTWFYAVVCKFTTLINFIL